MNDLIPYLDLIYDEDWEDQQVEKVIDREFDPNDPWYHRNWEDRAYSIEMPARGKYLDITV